MRLAATYAHEKPAGDGAAHWQLGDKAEPHRWHDKAIP